MNVSIKTMIPAAMLAVSAMTVASCGSKPEKETKMQNKIELAPYDSTKANLPIISDDEVTYRNIDGDIVNISLEGRVAEDNNSYLQRMTSLYKAINKFSTKETPNITNPERFYIEVEKIFQKIMNQDISRHQINFTL